MLKVCWAENLKKILGKCLLPNVVYNPLCPVFNIILRAEPRPNRLLPDWSLVGILKSCFSVKISGYQVAERYVIFLCYFLDIRSFAFCKFISDLFTVQWTIFFRFFFSVILMDFLICYMDYINACIYLIYKTMFFYHSPSLRVS